MINTARGGIINEAALYEALRDHAIGGRRHRRVRPGTGSRPTTRCSTLDNAIFTPHVAGLTTEAVYRMNVRAAQNVVDACDGVLDPEYVVNREVL